ncbi:hypothetical protein QYE76_029898 [Lolium multiflorum]|uniref:Jacalin-type lectin domain-containing protein n=1 Tax=Lolium multiflorum TaxID=4521 RepID=A0AAD8QNN6_LOLMU|nr:hypothetical protein QYE76_029898 [Lolium multiflorum]
MGPWGGKGRFAQDMIVKKSVRLESITINSGSLVYSLAFSYVDNQGKRHTKDPWGGTRGKIQTIELGPTEFLKEYQGPLTLLCLPNSLYLHLFSSPTSKHMGLLDR